MRKQKRESFLVMSMILFNDNNNIHSKEKKKDNDIKAHQIYTRKEKLTSYCTKCKCRQQKYSLTPPPTRKQH